MEGVEDAVLELLAHGSYLGVKNCLGETAVKRILPSTLETFLDSCVQENGQEISSQNFGITFDYRMLAPPLRSENEFGIIFSNGANDETISLQPSPSGDQQKVLPECEALWHLSCSSKHQYLLKHPLLTSFLMLKWHNIRYFYYFNVLIYSLAVLVLTSYILLLHSSYDSIQVLMDVLWYFLLTLVTVLFLREFLQFGIAPLRYAFSFENYIELVMLVCTVVVMFHWDDPVSWRHFSAVSVLLAWSEALLLLGRHPKLSTFVTMFTTVSTTFLRLLLWYSVLLVGFGLSFYLIFYDEEKENSDNKSESNAFVNVPASLLKVTAMMTGELEFGDLPFDSHPLTSRAIFLAFLFLITIVLLNLLNGMAVSDTQAIQSKAETIGYVSRVELISYMESMLLGDPFHFLANWPPFNWIRRCPSFSPIANLMRGEHLRKLIRTERTVLFYKCLPKKIFTVFPNRKSSSTSINDDQAFSEPRTGCPCHAKFRISEFIIQSASQKIQENQRMGNETQMLKEMEKLNAMVSNLQLQNARLLEILLNKTDGEKHKFSK